MKSLPIKKQAVTTFQAVNHPSAISGTSTRFTRVCPRLRYGLPGQTLPLVFNAPLRGIKKKKRIKENARPEIFVVKNDDAPKATHQRRL